MPLPHLKLAWRWQVYVSRAVLASFPTYLHSCIPNLPPCFSHHIPTHIHPSHHAPAIMPSRPAHPTIPRTFGPRPRIITDILFPTPSLAYFLANSLERVPIARLSPVHRRCIFCQARMCSEMHLPLPRTRPAAPAPDDDNDNDNDEEPENPPLPPSPSCPVPKHPRDTIPRLCVNPAAIVLPPSPAPDTCPDRSRCEIAVRVTMPGCGHVIGSRCLVGWLRLRNIKCPICQTLWFRSDDRSWVLVEGWPRPGVMRVVGGRGRVVQGW